MFLKHLSHFRILAELLVFVSLPVGTVGNQLGCAGWPDPQCSWHDVKRFYPWTVHLGHVCCLGDSCLNVLRPWLIRDAIKLMLGSDIMHSDPSAIFSSIKLTRKAFASSIILVTVLVRCSFPPSVGRLFLDARPHCSWARVMGSWHILKLE